MSSSLIQRRRNNSFIKYGHVNGLQVYKKVQTVITNKILPLLQVLLMKHRTLNRETPIVFILIFYAVTPTFLPDHYFFHCINFRR